jgi:hypothetical protein
MLMDFRPSGDVARSDFGRVARCTTTPGGSHFAASFGCAAWSKTSFAAAAIVRLALAENPSAFSSAARRPVSCS